MLFASVLLYFVAGLIVRNRVGEPYPALDMPGFPGIGLSEMSATEGATDKFEIFVTRIDGAITPIPLDKLCGDYLNSFGLAHGLFMTEPAAKARKATVAERLRKAIATFYHPVRPAPSSDPLAEFPDDTLAFIRKRTRELFPAGEARSIEFRIVAVRFPLVRPSSLQPGKVIGTFSVPVGP